jgi:hypothetical protein
MAEKSDSRVEIGGREAKTEDAVCRVRIYLSGTDPKSKKPIKTNITQTLYVRQSKVSDVSKQISKALG